MPYKAWGIEQVLPGDFNPLIQQQCVLTFPNTGARDVAILTPNIGMVCHIAGFGLQEYHGPVLGWTKPWGSAWGEIASKRSSAIAYANKILTVTQVAALTLDVPATLGRKYQLELLTKMSSHGPNNSYMSGGIVWIGDAGGFRDPPWGFEGEFGSGVAFGFWPVTIQSRVFTPAATGVVRFTVNFVATNTVNCDVRMNQGGFSSSFIANDVGPA